MMYGIGLVRFETKNQNGIDPNVRELVKVLTNRIYTTGSKAQEIGNRWMNKGLLRDHTPDERGWPGPEISPGVWQYHRWEPVGYDHPNDMYGLIYYEKENERSLVRRIEYPHIHERENPRKFSCEVTHWGDDRPEEVEI